MRKLTDREIVRGVRLKTDSLDTEVPQNFMEMEVVEDKHDHAIVRSISHPEQQGQWWKKFIINRKYYKMD